MVIGVQPTPGGSVEHPSTKSSAKKVKVSEKEGFVNFPLPFDVSAYSYKSFVPIATDTLLLPANCQRLSYIRPSQVAE